MSPRIRADDRTARHRPMPQPQRPGDPAGPSAAGAASPALASEGLGATHGAHASGSGPGIGRHGTGPSRNRSAPVVPPGRVPPGRHRQHSLRKAWERRMALTRRCRGSEGHGTGPSRSRSAPVVPPGRAPLGWHRQHSLRRAWERRMAPTRRGRGSEGHGTGPSRNRSASVIRRRGGIASTRSGRLGAAHGPTRQGRAAEGTAQANGATAAPGNPARPSATGTASPAPAPEGFSAAHAPTHPGRGSDGTAPAEATTTAPR
jgi:hypothetical protein